MPNVGYKHNQESLQKMRDSHKGKTLPLSQRIKIGQSQKGKIMSAESRLKISKARTGMKFSEAHRENLSKSHKGKYTGEKCSAWKGGVSFEPYCPKFNNEFRERVRAFFGYQCVECGTPQNGKLLAVHHVNFNKGTCCDNSIPLFVALCDSCHGKTGHNRPYWQEHFTKIINEKYGGKCYLPKGGTV